MRRSSEERGLGWKSVRTDGNFLPFDDDSVGFCRSGKGEPAGRSFHQRETAAESHPIEDRGDGGSGSASVRDIPSTASESRMREQDPQPISRDGEHPPRGDRGFQTPSCHPGGGETHRGLQEGQPRHLLLGDPRQTHQGLFPHPSFCPSDLALAAIDRNPRVDVLNESGIPQNQSSEGFTVPVQYKSMEWKGAKSVSA